MNETSGNPEDFAAGNAGLRAGDFSTMWHSRGYLPHFDDGITVQHVTLHLVDSLPAEVAKRMKEEFGALHPERQDPALRKKLEEWLDAGHGSCVLREPEVAAMVEESLLHFDGNRYRLIAWVVMPNHVHVLFEPINGWTVSKIVASWKAFTGKRIADLEYKRRDGARRSRHKGVWHRECWDRFIRDDSHLNQVIRYIHRNPVNARLVQRAEDWCWSSASRGRG